MNIARLPNLNAGTASEVAMLYWLYGLVFYMRPTLIVEAGTFEGHATIVMATALRDAKIPGLIYTADVDDYSVMPNCERNGVQDYVKPFWGDYCDLLDGPLAGRSIDLAFIDSGPCICKGEVPPERLIEITMRSRHIKATLPRLAPNGVVVVDDMAAADDAWLGVKEFRDIAGLYLSAGRGMALLQRRA